MVTLGGHLDPTIHPSAEVRRALGKLLDALTIYERTACQSTLLVLVVAENDGVGSGTRWREPFFSLDGKPTTATLEQFVALCGNEGDR